MVEVLPDDAPAPRLCHLLKWPDFDGYGFNLHAERSNPGQFIGKIDDQSPAQLAGLREGDRIIEVNGVNISIENHRQVVERIKSMANEARLLVVDPQADRWYSSRDLVVKSSQLNVIYMKTPATRPTNNDGQQQQQQRESAGSADERGVQNFIQQQQQQQVGGPKVSQREAEVEQATSELNEQDSIEAEAELGRRATPAPMSPDSGRGLDAAGEAHELQAEQPGLLVCRAEINRQAPPSPPPPPEPLASELSKREQQQKQQVVDEVKQRLKRHSELRAGETKAPASVQSDSLQNDDDEDQLNRRRKDHEQAAKVSSLF